MTTEQLPYLHAENLCFCYPMRDVLRNVSLSLCKGEIVSLIGGSGSGKTTLLKILSGILVPQSGRVSLGENSVPSSRHKMAFMMQQDLLLPWRTVLGNVMLAGEIEGINSANLQLEAIELLHAVNLFECRDLFPDALSKGMRQRVALARVLLQQRPVLLLDEPFAALDVLLREQLYHLLRQLCSRNKTTVILVTHDFRDALVLSDRVMCLSSGTISKEWVIPIDVHQDAASMGMWQEKLKNSLSVDKWI